ncbi:unnamed protein product, partial [Hapterophycus canaliculatus]
RGGNPPSIGSTATMSGEVALPDGWASHSTDQGMVYFYNIKTGQTTWEHPDGEVRCVVSEEIDRVVDSRKL